MSDINDIARTCFIGRRNENDQTCKNLVRGREGEFLNAYKTMFQTLKNASTITKKQLRDFTRLAYVRAGLQGQEKKEVYEKDLLLINSKFMGKEGGRKRRRSRRKSRRGGKKRKSRRKRRKSRKKRKSRRRRRR